MVWMFTGGMGLGHRSAAVGEGRADRDNSVAELVEWISLLTATVDAAVID